MSILTILQYPDKRLRIIAKPVLQVNKYIKRLINNMFDTMYAKEGIGLAATQINIHLQIIVISNIGNYSPFALINPKIIKKSGKISIEEGCLSIPNITKKILRANQIHLHAIDFYGNNFQLTAKSLLSVCIQHEIDHLMGKLFIDYPSNNG